MAKGEALLLVDGLDEITNPRVRMMFCQEIELTAARYPDAPIVVTSRIVGYRDMPYRMGSRFEHGQIAELNRADKDLFVSRWVEVTEQHQTAGEKTKRAKELRDALDSNDRIERLTGNPMLLTTLALVKRKVGKLPNKRSKLYAEAVSVLLNWNPRLYQTIEEDEAIPQLEYLAYEMCLRGVQRLADNEVLDLLDKLRDEYPNIRAIKRRKPWEFLKHLEERSSILIKSGGIPHKDTKQENPVWEFRHLTFQEYLAAQALLDGRYPGRDRTKSLADQVAPLAGALQKSKVAVGINEEVEVHESWREALRLLVTDCNDDDVDDVVLAILAPGKGENVQLTNRPRAILGALCLSDEPNVSESIAQQVLTAFASSVNVGDGSGSPHTSLDRTAIEVASCIWSTLLKDSLIHEFSRRPQMEGMSVGGLWGMAELASWKRAGTEPQLFFNELVKRLQSGDRVETVSAALTVMQAAYAGQAVVVDKLIESLLDILVGADYSAKHASAWALYWLNRGAFDTRKPLWSANPTEVSRLVQALDSANAKENSTRIWLIRSLGRSGDGQAFSSLARHLNDASSQLRFAIIQALGQSGDKQGVAPLLAILNDPDDNVRRAVVKALYRLGDKQAVMPLLAKLDDSDTQVRLNVIEAVAEWGDKRAVAPLLGKLGDVDKRVRCVAIEALGQLGDKQAVTPLLSTFDDPDKDVQLAVIKALGQLGDKQAVTPLLSTLNDSDKDVQLAVIKALSGLSDEQVVAPLLAMLDIAGPPVRLAIISALVQLGHKLTVAPLLALLDDADPQVRLANIRALGQLGDKLAVPPLLRKLDDPNPKIQASVAAALHALKETKGTALLKLFLTSEDAALREIGVGAYGYHRGLLDQKLLSRDLDATDPWLDPRGTVTKSRLAVASNMLNLSFDQIRSRYKAMVLDLDLQWGWQLA